MGPPVTSRDWRERLRRHPGKCLFPHVAPSTFLQESPVRKAPVLTAAQNPASAPKNPGLMGKCSVFVLSRAEMGLV